MARKYNIRQERAWQDLTGRKFYKLLLLEVVGRPPSGKGRLYLCQCDCGNKIVVRDSNVKYGNTKSCGCDKFMFGKAHKTKIIKNLHNTWVSMNQRCSVPDDPNFHHYGGRGIVVCDRWKFGDSDKSGYDCFAEDVGIKPDGMSLDRIDVNGNYEPSNCRWANDQQQSRNRRSTDKCRQLPEELSKFCDDNGIKRDTMFARIDRGWRYEELFLPVMKKTERRVRKK